MFGEEGSLSFHFRYIPAERMAGDWLFKGQGKDGSQRFILGDVTGKGPAAALAVAATIGALRQKDLLNDDITSTVQDLNKHLFTLFRGKAGTSVCLVDIAEDGNAKIAVHAMAGWLHISAEKIKLLSARGSTIGSQNEISTSLIEVKLEAGDILLCFSDGCLEGARTMRKLVDALNKLGRAEITADKIFDTVVEIGKDSVQPDDQALIMIKKVA
jgi:serine phosphatase RsbU (regulator of sigma subunit)